MKSAVRMKQSDGFGLLPRCRLRRSNNYVRGTRCGTTRLLLLMFDFSAFVGFESRLPAALVMRVQRHQVIGSLDGSRVLLAQLLPDGDTEFVDLRQMPE
jgi:hypothetical protein